MILHRTGYSVMEADSGASALELWPAPGDRIDLVMTDMVMPGGLSGLALAEVLMARHEHLKVITTSGYSVDLAGKELERSGRISFLAKPYSARQLLGAVQSQLDESSA